MAQPLYVKGISISGTTYNMVVAVTLNTSIFAWSESGTLLWSRQDTGGTAGTNALYWDDCNQTGSSPVPQTDTLQFSGILSTPVIDATESYYTTAPVIFVTSYCQTSASQQEWWLHEIDLTTGRDVMASGVAQKRRIHTDFTSFIDGWERQRAALLHANNTYNTTTPDLIYALFGTGTAEDRAAKDYTGWVVAYSVNSSGLSPAFGYSDEPAGTSGSSGCSGGGGLNSSGLFNGQCSSNSGTPGCDCEIQVQCPVTGDTCNYSTGYCTTNTTTKCTPIYQNAPNWGGHGGGCWMSGNGPAATVAGAISNSGGSDNAVHVFFGCGNGGFQQFNGTTPDAANNNGQSIIDFRLKSSGFDSTSAFQTFTPKSPANGVAPPLPSTNVCGCANDGTGCSACTTTLQTQNVNDLDMATGGVALFNDLAGTQRLVVSDKAGYGYLMTQGQLCGSSFTADTGCVGFQANDPGSWTFGASATLCSGAASDCDRVTSMAIYDNQGSNSTRCGSGSGARCVYLISYPNNERLTSALLSDNNYQWPGTGTLTWSSPTPSKTLNLSGACTYDQNCLGDQIVAGDTLALTGCTCTGGTCPTVTSVYDASDGSNSNVTINTTITSAYGSCTSGRGFSYTGWFVTPAHDANPANSAAIGFPGGAVTVTANCTSRPCSGALIWVVTPSYTSQDGIQNRGLGKLWAYKALPNAEDELANKWALPAI